MTGTISWETVKGFSEGIDSCPSKRASLINLVRRFVGGDILSLPAGNALVFASTPQDSLTKMTLDGREGCFHVEPALD